MIRRYELALVATPALPEAEHDRVISSFEELIASLGGTVQKVDRWGRRKLAYSIRKFSEGNYTVILYDGQPDVEKEIVRRIKLSDNFLRFLSVRADEERVPTDEEREQLAFARAEILRKAEERAAAEAAGLVYIEDGDSSDSGFGDDDDERIDVDDDERIDVDDEEIDR